MGSPTVVLGLGNPGTRYTATRHNLGYRVVERLAREAGVVLRAQGVLASRARTAEIERPGSGLVLAQPRSYMNHSGRAAAALCRHYAVPPDHLIVVYDDADLELGRMRVRGSGRAGGHRGLRSVIEALGSVDFPRIRLGVRGAGRAEANLEEYVLEPFAREEEPVVAALVELAAAAVEVLVEAGLTVAMDRFNGMQAKMASPEGGC